MNNIELKAIKDLLGMNFYIPNYQRGYRWSHQQVKDLLGDIKEFMDKIASDIKDNDDDWVDKELGDYADLLKKIYK
jgi:uncharacterized protein with ParB-like and HNH nuclease domain